LKLFCFRELYIEMNLVLRWTIQVRIGNKTPVRTFENARGHGKIFSCDLIDHSGAIRATAFNSECDKFYSILQVGKVCLQMFLSKRN